MATPTPSAPPCALSSRQCTRGSTRRARGGPVASPTTTRSAWSSPWRGCCCLWLSLTSSGPGVLWRRPQTPRQAGTGWPTA
eukprot:4960824-Lingulodinium_polyedra.AAC.1